MPYITYVNLAHQIASFILSLLTVYYCVNILFRKSILKKSVKLSPAIIVYFGLAFISSLSGTPYFAYMIIFWRPEGGDYNAYVIFSAIVTPGLLVGTSSIVEAFLCIERCLTLLFPLKYSKNLRICFAILTFFGFLGAIATLTIMNRYFDMFPSNSSTTCQYYTCIVSASNKYLFFGRIGLNIINIIFASILAYLIKKIIVNSNSAAQMNRTVFIIILSTTLIEFVPFVIGQAYAIITGEQLFQYIGPYSSTAVIFNVTFSIKLYYKAFRQLAYQNSNHKIINVGTVNTNTNK